MGIKEKSLNNKLLILYDGVCNFCNSSVMFVAERDKQNNFVFAHLQSEIGLKYRQNFKLPTDIINTLVLVENQKAFIKSTAALRIARNLSGLWPLLYIFIVFPPFLRDFVYDFVAKNRYRWFGKSEVCKLPDPQIKEKFIG